MPVEDLKRLAKWTPRLALGASISLLGALAAGAAEAPVALGPDQSLAEALEVEGDRWWVCLDGGLPRPLEALRPPAGDHRVLLLREQAGELVASGWHEVAVAGGDPLDWNAPARLTVDRSPPRASFYASGPHLGGSDGVRLAPQTGVRMVFSDLSGVSYWEASDRHPGSSHQGRWLPGYHHLTVVASDTAGNRGVAGEWHFEVDAEGPKIDWRIAGEGLQVAGGEPIYRSPATLIVSAVDPSGVTSVQALVDEVWQPLDAETVTVAADSMALRARDGLGNWRTTEARWRYDRRGPEISVRAPEGEIRGSAVVLPVNGVLLIEVEDEGAGVAESHYRYNSKPVRPLPRSIRFLDRGRYRLEIQSRDRLGNETVSKWRVRAVNRAGKSRRRGSGERR